jgi:hypothetical protein
MRQHEFGNIELGWILAVFVVMPFMAWVTHIASCINHEQWLLLLSGAILFPIGILHGTGLWFGLF